MRIAFVGSVAFSETALKHVLALPGVDVVGVATLARATAHADFRSLAPLARG